jgi:hypothetical protein
MFSFTGYLIYTSYFQNIGSIDDRLTAIDTLINQGHMKKAKKEILKVNLKKTDSHLLWLRLIKRAYEFSIISEDYDLLSTITDQALKYYPYSQDFQAFHIQSLLKLKKYNEAKEYAVDLNNPNFASIKKTVSIYAMFNGSYDSIKKATSELNKYDPNYYEKLAFIINSPKLFYDTMILWLKQGNIDRAKILLPKIIMSQEVSPLYQTFMAYFLHDYPTVSNLLPTLSGQNFSSFENAILGDIYYNLYLDKNEKLYLDLSYDYYLRSVSIDPKYSWKTYLKLAILSKTDMPNTALQFIESGLRYFISQKDLILAYAVLSKDQVKVEYLLQKLSPYTQDDPSINLYKIMNNKNKMPPEQQSYLLWTLVNKHPNSYQLAQYMIWFLLSHGNIEDSLKVIDFYKEKDANWVSFYKALIYSQSKEKGSIDLSLSQFSGYLSIENVWQVHYNLGLLYIYTLQYPDALKHLLQAQTLGESIGNISKIELARIYAKLSLIYLSNEQYLLSRKNAEIALTFDNANPDALRVLNINKIEN